MIQRDLAELRRDNPRLANLLGQLDDVYADFVDLLYEVGVTRHRLLTSANEAFTSMEAAHHTPDAVLAYIRAMERIPMAAPRSVRHQSAVGQLPRLSDLLNSLNSLLRQVRGVPGVREVVEARREERATREQAQQREQAQRELGQWVRRYVRRQWSHIRTNPRFHRDIIASHLREELSEEEDFNAFIVRPPGQPAELGRFLRLLMRNPTVIERNRRDVLRAAVLAVGGEWADMGVSSASAEDEAARLRREGVELSQEDRDRLEAAALTGDDGSTGTTAEVTGSMLDMAITVIPVLDQLGDARDLAAHVGYLVDLDGRHPREHTKFSRWLSVALTGIGLVPEAGSVLKWIGTVAKRFMASGTVTARIVARVIDMARRALTSDVVVRLGRRVTQGWDAIAGVARRGWERVVGLMNRWVASPVVRVAGLTSEWISARIARWRAAAPAGARRIPQALGRFRDFFRRLFERLAEAGRGLAGRAVRAIPRRLRARARLARIRAGELIDRARGRIAHLRLQFSSGTTRLQHVTGAYDEVDGHISALRHVRDGLEDARQRGDAEGVEELLEQAEQLEDRLNTSLDTLDRRLAASRGAAMGAEPASGAAASPHLTSRMGARISRHVTDFKRVWDPFAGTVTRLERPIEAQFGEPGRQFVRDVKQINAIVSVASGAGSWLQVLSRLDTLRTHAGTLQRLGSSGGTLSTTSRSGPLHDFSSALTSFIGSFTSLRSMANTLSGDDIWGRETAGESDQTRRIARRGRAAVRAGVDAEHH